MILVNLYLALSVINLSYLHRLHKSADFLFILIFICNIVIASLMLLVKNGVYSRDYNFLFDLSVIYLAVEIIKSGICAWIYVLLFYFRWEGEEED